LGNKYITKKQVKEFKALIKSSGVLDKVSGEIDAFLGKARKIVNKSKLLKPNYKNIFIGLADFLENRKF